MLFDGIKTNMGTVLVKADSMGSEAGIQFLLQPLSSLCTEIHAVLLGPLHHCGLATFIPPIVLQCILQGPITQRHIQVVWG
jgi:hypothetical protein